MNLNKILILMLLEIILIRFKKKRIISSYKNSNKIIANSSYTKDLMQVSLNIKREKIKVIHPGIDIYKDFISPTDEIRIKNIIKVLIK